MVAHPAVASLFDPHPDELIVIVIIHIVPISTLCPQQDFAKAEAADEDAVTL